MKRVVTILAVVLAVGCASVQNGDKLKLAALQAIGAERVAWITNNTSAQPNIDVVSLKDMKAYIENVDATNGTALVTYWYTGTFNTPQGPRDGTLTVQRRLHFTRSDSGTWKENGTADEVARNSSWSAARATS